MNGRRGENLTGYVLDGACVSCFRTEASGALFRMCGVHAHVVT